MAAKSFPMCKNEQFEKVSYMVLAPCNMTKDRVGRGKQQDCPRSLD